MCERESVCVCVCVHRESWNNGQQPHSQRLSEETRKTTQLPVCRAHLFGDKVSGHSRRFEYSAGLDSPRNGLAAVVGNLHSTIPLPSSTVTLLLLQCGSPHVHWIDWDGDIEERSESGEMSDECRSGFVVESPLGAGVQGGVAAAGGVVDRVRCLVDMCEGEGGGNSEHMAGVLQQVLEGIRSTLALLPEDACSEDWESLSIQGLRCLEAGIRWSVS